MTTYNTGNPLGSSAAKDLYDNAQNLDHLSNDQVNEKWPDRFGKERLTWHGIERMSLQAIAGYGYITMDSFQAGANLTQANQVLRDQSDGEYYRWDGAFPKSVPVGSTPDSTGGIGSGKWLSVGDAVLRNQLYEIDGLKLVGKCSSVAQLRTIVAENNWQLITLDSYRPGSNKGGGIFQWNATSNDPDDSGVVIAVTGVATGRWIRQVNGRYTPEMYGADGTKTNDPSAVKSLLQHQKYVLFSGVYYMNDEFVTNGHNIEGGSTGEYYGDGSKTKIVFFGGFSAKQAVRNEITKSSYKNITFEPESWDPVDGYTGTGLRVGRTLDAENCNWFKFKEFGVDLWASITEGLVHYPYGSQFRNCRFEFNGFNGIRFTNGANSVQIYGGTASWNGSPAYGVKPTDSSTGWDGILFTKVTDGSVPPMDNDFDIQGNIIEGIDCSYNARYGFNADYANQSIFNIGYSEANFGPVDVHVRDVVACTINIQVSQRGEDIDVPNYSPSTPRSSANYPNSIVVAGVDYGSGSKDDGDRYISWRNPRYGITPFSFGALGNSGFRSYKDKSGSFETYNEGGGALPLFRANSGPLPTAAEKYLGTLWRDTSTGPNPVYICVENSPGSYLWSKLN
ncbi:tail fiber/spike domain-containing protein [Citrobacter freundii]